MDMDTEALGCGRAHDSVKKLNPVAKVAAVAAVCAVLCFALPLGAQEKPEKEAAGGKGSKGAGIYFNAEASAKDVGLPMYPGARPHKEKDNDSESTKMGLWGGSFAFKLAVLKLESNDSPEKIATFYKKALAKYGTVLDCREASSQTREQNGNKSSKQLTCEDDKPKPGEMEFKAGTQEKQHIVGIQPNGGGSLFQLVYVESPDSDKDK
ncbi:MAG TPA: hypothetical protein VGR55_18655 [Candidatus Acidoferrum sp.]|nr:hypothetical protein [Candidatus Acidoferrum sp.]